MMAHKTWVRPEEVPYPSVWNEFKRKSNGSELHFVIQDVTEDLFPACVQFMTKYFLPDEPMYASLGVLNDAVSVEEQIKWWEKVLPEKLSLICLQKDVNNPAAEPQIAGMNLLYYHHKSHDDAVDETKGAKFKTIIDIVKQVEAQVDRYKMFDTEDYIDEFGLCVHPKYRGMGIATELLKARVPLLSAIGLRNTFTIFSAIGSQKAADKAGYKDLVEVKFSDLAKLFPSYPLNVKDTPSIRYMYLPIIAQ